MDVRRRNGMLEKSAMVKFKIRRFLLCTGGVEELTSTQVIATRIIAMVI